MTSTVQDRIEREITINAPVERVWPLVSQPGWWIGDGDITAQKRYREGDLEAVEDPKYGKFLLRVEGTEPFRYAAFRWVIKDAGDPVAPPDGGNATLVEFWISEVTGGATRVRVVESGFAALAGSDDERARFVERNTDGWRQQLDILKARAEHVAV